MAEFSEGEWDRIGAAIKEEKEERKKNPRRQHLELQWAQIDRQLSMIPVERVLDSGSKDAWMPNTEWPTQFNALEVILDDADRMSFPQGREWFTVSSYMSDKYVNRFEKRRDKFPLIGDDATPIIFTQETADILVKAAFDHFHSIYDFRGMNKILMGEEIKYGTSDSLVRATKHPHFDENSRGKMITGPALVPFSIKNTYLDDSPTAVLREGFKKRGTIIRKSHKHLEDLKRAARSGGAERGWRMSAVNQLEAQMEKDKNKDQIEILVSDGDHFLIDRWLPNTRITVAVANNDRKVIRFEEDEDNEHLTGYYLRDDVNSPYGVSPLMKGAPIQQALSEGVNRMMMTAALEGEPPVAYDRYDAALAAQGGPDLGPGGMNETENPDSIKQILTLDPTALIAVVQFLNKAYEDVTGVNDPRRGAETKSHTTAFAKDIESARGQVRTESYIEDRERGLMTTMLYKEWKIIKRTMTKPTPIFVDAKGIKGWVVVSAADLPDQIGIVVHGALGPLAERENIETKQAAFTNIIQLVTAAAQLKGAGFDIELPKLDIEAMSKDIAQDAGINDTERFITKSAEPAQQPQGGPGVQGAGGAAPSGAAQGPALPPG